MDYEKKYKEALERAKDMLSYKEVRREDMEYLFPELKENEDEQMRKALLEMVHDTTGDDLWIDYNVHKEDVIAWLKKQGEQNPVDKIEPKFKTGQWIVWQDKCYKVNYNGCGYELVDQNGLSTSLEYGTVNENAHLWDITKDAKEGDTLVTESGRPFIFKGCLDERHPNSPVAYCGIDCGDDFHVSVNISWWADGNVFPATKEQCDFLFQEMKDAGYEWDAEKKELKKIEQTVEIPFGAKDSELQEATYHIPDGYHAEINGNEVVIKKGEQKTTWKPTEEQIEALEHFLETIRRYEYSYFHEETFLWLHSLLEQLKKL